MNRQQLDAPEGVFEAIPELELDQPATLALNGLSLKKIAAGFACRPRLYLISLVLVHAV